MPLALQAQGVIRRRVHSTQPTGAQPTGAPSETAALPGRFSRDHTSRIQIKLSTHQPRTSLRLCRRLSHCRWCVAHTMVKDQNREETLNTNIGHRSAEATACGSAMTLVSQYAD